MKTQKLLDEETERNKDDIAHCEALQKHYDDRVTVYEVRRIHSLSRYCSHWQLSNRR
jgi:structural maintenance of chromosome 4